MSGQNHITVGVMGQYFPTPTHTRTDPTVGPPWLQNPLSFYFLTGELHDEMSVKLSGVVGIGAHFFCGRNSP